MIESSVAILVRRQVVRVAVTFDDLTTIISSGKDGGPTVSPIALGQAPVDAQERSSNRLGDG
jgi:hypothetical protein